LITYLLPIVTSVVLLIADQLTKAYFVANFNLGESAKFIPGLIDFIYIHNTGSAWGMFSGKTLFLTVVTVAAIIACIIYLVRLKDKNLIMTWAIMLIVSGGIGNLIDRVFRGGRVVDFLHFEFWPDFPIFNVADCGVVVGGGLLILAFIIDFVKESKCKK